MVAKVAVIGGGPAGLTAAYELLKRGVAVELFEAQPSVGGMARSFTLWGQTVDCGPHRFFSVDPRVNTIWLEAVGHDYDMVDRLTRIYYKGAFFNYPLKMRNALVGLGPGEAIRCVVSYAHALLFPLKNESTFDNWVINRFGRRLFEIFFKSYSEKLWGIPCQQLDADFAAQRIKRFSLSEALKSAVFNVKTNHKTLVDQFAYPLKGSGFVYERLAQLIAENGGVVRLNAEVAKVDVSVEPPVIELNCGERREYDAIVSSMPITTLVQRMDLPPGVCDAAKALTFRNTILVYLEVAGDGLFPDQWIYVHAGDLKTGRITNFRNWVPSLYGQSPNTILCLEYWCDDDDDLWTAEEGALVDLATKEIRKLGLIGDRPILNGKRVRIPKCYPVYAAGYKKHLAIIQSWLSRFERLSVIGRYGAFKYNNQDHSILMGYLAARNIAAGESNDLWQINTDYEYQEASLITKSGLQKQ